MTHNHGHHDNHDNHMDHSNHDNHDMHSNHPEYNVIDEHGVSEHGSIHDHGAHDGHHMTFFNIEKVATMLFQHWQLNSPRNIFLACLCTLVLAIGYTGIKWLRQYLHVHWHHKGKLHSIRSKEHFLQTILYVTEFIVSYVLMLTVMTYNVWIFIVTILGITLGYFVLAWHKEFFPTSSGSCAEKCRESAVKSLKYERNPSSQELMPLEGGCIPGNETGACRGCSIEDYDKNDVQ